MIREFLSSGYKKVSRFSLAALLVISGSGITPLLFHSTAHASIVAPINGIYINEFSSYGDNDWIELYSKNSRTVSLEGLSLRFHDPATQQLNLDGYILAGGLIKLDIGNKLNRTGGSFSLSNGSSSQLINYGNTTVVGYKAVGAPGIGQVGARIEGFSGYTWTLTSAASPGKHNNPPFSAPLPAAPIDQSVQQTKDVTFSWQPIERAFMYSLSVSRDPNFLQTATLNSNGVKYALNSTQRTYTLEEGTYYWRVIAYRDGTAGPWSEVRTFTVDTAAPTVAFTHPSPDDGSYVNSDFDVSLTAHDSNKLDSVSVSLLDTDSPDEQAWRAGCSYTDLAVSDLTRTCRVHLPAALPDGTYTLRIDGRDQAGIQATSQSRSIHIDRTKPASPVLIGPANDIKTRGNSITHTWTDSSTDVDHYVYESYDDAEATRTRQSEKVTTTSMTSTHTADVTYWWRVKAVDKAGNESDWSELWSVTIDNTAPVFAGETNYTLLTGKTITLAPIVAEENVGYQWTLGDNKKSLLTNRDASLTDPTLTIGHLAKGEYTVKLVMTDQVGNSTDPIEYRINVITPSSVRPSSSR